MEGTDYSSGFASGTYVDAANPTPAEIQTVVDAVNDLLGSAKVLAGIDKSPATAPEINAKPGVDGAVAGTDYAD